MTGDRVARLDQATAGAADLARLIGRLVGELEAAGLARDEALRLAESCLVKLLDG